MALLPSRRHARAAFSVVNEFFEPAKVVYGFGVY